MRAEMVHLDTNFLILGLQPDTPEAASLRGWIESGESLCISAVAWAEFLCGPLDANDKALAFALFSRVEPLLAADAEKGAELFNLTGRRSRSLADSLIAAVAMRCDAKLATGNRADFQPFVSQGLILV